jgi:hypothetical protein
VRVSERVKVRRKRKRRKKGEREARNKGATFKMPGEWSSPQLKVKE